MNVFRFRLLKIVRWVTILSLSSVLMLATPVVNAIKEELYVYWNYSSARNYKKA